MKRKFMIFLVLIANFKLLAQDPSPTQSVDGKPEIITPDWAVEPIGPMGPPPKISEAKLAAAVILGTAVAITIGLIASGSNTGLPAYMLKQNNGNNGS